jgi:hypothetical protein
MATGFDAAAIATPRAIEQAQRVIDFESATPEEIAAGLQAWAIDDLQPQFEAIEAAAPAELDAAVETYGAAIAELAETGDPSVFEARARRRRGDHPRVRLRLRVVHGRCLQSAFTGLEETYEPGPLSIDLTNEGDEVQLSSRRRGGRIR